MAIAGSGFATRKFWARWVANSRIWPPNSAFIADVSSDSQGADSITAGGFGAAGLAAGLADGELAASGGGTGLSLLSANLHIMTVGSEIARGVSAFPTA